MKPYTKSDSQRSEGCVAADGGQTCPFLSRAWSSAVAFIVVVASGEDAWTRELRRGRTGAVCGHVHRAASYSVISNVQIQTNIPVI